MNRIILLALSVLLVLMVSCSDGSQISSRINKLVKDHKIEQLVIEIDGQKEVYKLPKKGTKPPIIVEDQFLWLNDSYINLSRTKSIKVNGKSLEIKL